MAQTGTRPAGKAGSWYTGNKAALSKELDEWLDQVPSTLNESSLPIPGARVIIAPHAGYAYSGECAAWAYKALDLSNVKRIFVLGPSHTYYLKGCALTRYAKYATPFGDLIVDASVTEELRDTGKFSDIRNSTVKGRSVRDNDVEEHSLEMHLPYIYKRCSQTFSSEAEYPTIVPIMVGDNNGSKEKAFGELLAPYLKDPETAFVVSSDFCHWGSRFSYTPYTKGAPIHEHIKDIDHQAMDAIEGGKHDDFVGNLAETENTVCGRHPIGVTMAALEVLSKESAEEGKYRFKFVQYQRSGLVDHASDSSVSYASAYAIV
ncbi:MEMO1 family [Truncatella angustata]|uniref:MEMO1 family n=1 Tax=Truncatella angustata TaxID=152316 RepID=A0A9P8US05_9PEZI|nr:MEMO1 family [Truncatella angustata]KAH6656970.1 MEMO1 family [Truncatella angustata]